MANHSSVLVWRISRTEGLGLAGYRAGGSQRHNGACTHTQNCLPGVRSEVGARSSPLLVSRRQEGRSTASMQLCERQPSRLKEGTPEVLAGVKDSNAGPHLACPSPWGARLPWTLGGFS